MTFNLSSNETNVRRSHFERAALFPCFPVLRMSVSKGFAQGGMLSVLLDNSKTMRP
jgi:hypothetical protein